MYRAMSAEKFPFILLAVFTIGPKADEPKCLLKYARLLSAHDKLSHHVNDLVQGDIEGETRVLAASMTMEQIFKGTKEFKTHKTQMEAANQARVDVAEARMKGEIGWKTRGKERHYKTRPKLTPRRR
ncbi:hypothetical protein K1719_044047 [Acacia pycnantha]|nr:hypothetical protein K1719_044047 [Acacia pycnantha]